MKKIFIILALTFIAAACTPVEHKQGCGCAHYEKDKSEKDKSEKHKCSSCAEDKSCSCGH